VRDSSAWRDYEGLGGDKNERKGRKGTRVEKGA
jgi:hypothetical protein